MLRIEIDAVNKSFTGLKEFTHGGITVMLSDIFAHPFPQPFDGIKVRTVGGKCHKREAQFEGSRLDDLGPVTGGAIPNDDHGARGVTEPVLETPQKLDALLAITVAFVPDKTLPVAEVIGAVPIDAIGQTGAITRAPSRFTGRGPGIAQV